MKTESPISSIPYLSSTNTKLISITFSNYTADPSKPAKSSQSLSRVRVCVEIEMISLVSTPIVSLLLGGFISAYILARPFPLCSFDDRTDWSSILITEYVCNPFQSRSKMAELLFDTYEVPLIGKVYPDPDN